MALTQEQVDWWFSQNPDATAEEVAEAVKSVGGLEGNEGLAGMIANRYAISEPEVTNYYNAYTAPETPNQPDDSFKNDQKVTDVDTGPIVDIFKPPTFTDNSNATVAAPLAAPLAPPAAETSEVYLGDNRWLNTATGQIRTDWSQSAPVKQIVREEDRDGRHYRYYNDGSVDSSVLSTDTFLDFVGDVAPDIALKTALIMAGGPAGAELGLTLGTGLNTALDLGLSTAAQQALGSGLIRGTLADATGGDFVTGALSGAAASSPNLTLGDTGITLGNLNTANKILNANDAASVLSALAADKTISGATSGLLDASTTQALNTGLQVNNIVTQLQAGNEGAALTLLGDLAGSSDLKIAGNAIKAIDAIESGNFGALTNAVVNLSNTAGSKIGTSGSTSGAGSTTVGNFEDNEVTRLKGLGYTNAQIQDYFNTLDNLTGAFDETAGTTGTTTSGLPTGVQLASLGDGVFRTDIGGTPIYAESKNAGSVTTPFGYSLLSATEADNKPEGSYYDPTANAWFKPDTSLADLAGGSTLQADLDLFTGSQGDLDQIAASTPGTSDDATADFLASIGITNSTQLADSGLSNSDILDLVNADTDTSGGTGDITGGNITDTTGLDTGDVIPTGDDVPELVVTGDKTTNTDTTTIDTITGGDGNDLIVDDKGEVVIKDKKESCPIGTVLNPETGECDAIEDKGEVVIKDKKESCPVGTKLNPETGECDPIVEDKKTLECPEGYEPNDDGTACIPVIEIKDKKCDPGYVYDEDLKQCVPVTKALECPEGFHLSADGLSCEPDTKGKLECPEGYEPNDDGTACIPVVVIKDKKCDPGYVYDEDLQMCVPIKDDTCPVGFHKDESGQCVPDKKALECPEGYELNDAGTECIPVVVIKDKKCDPGYVYDEDLKQCVPIKDEGCAEGFHLENGICVPDDDETCKDGYEKVNGVCVPVCKEGYVRNLKTGACEKVEDKGCPPGQIKNAEGKCVPIVTTPPKPPKTCPTGYVLVGDTCVPLPTMPTSALPVDSEKIDPIYATGMDDFDLFATLEELLNENSDKTDKKKDSKKSKEKTKMATGGHLDDLLAEQMTVDDLLKLLR